MFNESLPISLIRQFLFCQRIPYFSEVLGIRGVKPTWVKTGNQFHSKQVILSKQRTLKRFDLDEGKIHFDINLTSENIGIHGICDGLIETEEEVVPIEIKNSASLTFATKLQVIGYGLVAEEVFNKKLQIGFALLGPKGKAQLIEISIEERDLFFKELEKLQNVINKRVMPESDATNVKCAQCEYLNFCNDREL